MNVGAVKVVAVCAVCAVAGLASPLLPPAALIVLVIVAVALPSLAIGRKLFVGGRAAAPKIVGRSSGSSYEASRDGLRLARAFYYLGLLFLGQLVLRPLFSTTLSDWFFVISLMLALMAAKDRLSVSVGVVGLVMIGTALFLIGASIATLSSSDPVASLVVTAKFGYLTVVWFWLGSQLLRTRAHVHRAVMFWVASVAIAGTAAIAQYFLGDVIPGTSPEWGRMPGTGDHVNDLGAMAAIALVPAFVVGGRLLPGPLRIVPPLLIFVGLLLSGAVAGMIAAAGALLVWFGLGHLPTRALVLVAVLVTASVVIVQSGGSELPVTPLQRIERVTSSSDDPGATLWTRLETYRASLKRISENPIVGTGLASSDGLTTSGFVVHNVLLGPSDRAGLLGGLGMLLILFSVARIGRTIFIEASTEDRPLCAALFSAFVAFLLFGMTAPILFQRYGWVAAALILAYYWQSRRDSVSSVVAVAPAVGLAVHGVARGLASPPRAGTIGRGEPVAQGRL